MLGDWFGNATHGVDAMLDLVPRDVGTPQPADFALVTTESQDGDTARNELPKSRPCLTVAADHVVDEDGQIETVTGDGKIKVRVRVGIDNADTAAAVAELGVRLRAVKWSMRRFTDSRFNPENDPSRTRNDIYVESCLDLASQIIWTQTQTEGATVSGYVIGQYRVRDLTPTGT
jgi:hypothetical protein